MDNGSEKEYKELSLLEIIKMFFLSKIKTKNVDKISYNQKASQQHPDPPENVIINSIAIILDGRVEEVIRCENRLAALLLSEPEFTEFDPKKISVKIGKTEYVNGILSNPAEEIISEEEMNVLIQKEKNKGNNV